MNRLFVLVFCSCICFSSLGQPIAKLIDSVVVNESKNYGWFPSVQMLSTGELICDISLDPDENEMNNIWAYLISTDKGKTWGRRHTAGAFYREAAYTRDPALKDGSMIMLAGIPIPGPFDDFNNIQTTSLRLSDGGKSALFIDDVKIHLPVSAARLPMRDGKIKEGANMFFTGGIVRSGSDGWLTLMYGKLKGDRFYRTILVKSADLKDWKYVTTVAGDKETDAASEEEGKKTYQGFCESRMIRLNDGRLFVVMRTGYANLIYRTWSADEGKTWSTPVSIGFRGVEPSMMVMKNGLIALCTGRPGPVTLRFSKDDGKEWMSPIELNTNIPVKGYTYATTSYTGIVEVEKNKLFIVYDAVNHDLGRNPDSDPDAKNRIYGKLFEVNYPDIKIKKKTKKNR